MRNILLTLSYEGTDFFGWQKTKEGPSIEESLENALFFLLGERPFLQAASRTDRGVHAKDQKVNFITSKTLSLKDLPRQLQSFLPPSIALSSAEEVPLSFHPSLHTKKKEYHYCISTGSIQNPFLLATTWHYPLFLDVGMMKESAISILGLHDFSAFSKEYTNNPLCDLKRFEVLQTGASDLLLIMEADRFLYRMARTLAGTIAMIGSGKIRGKSLLDILLSKDRKQAGQTAPACGLFLEKITYPQATSF